MTIYLLNIGSIQLDKDDSIIAGTNLMGNKKSEKGGGARRDAALIAKVEQLIAVNQQILAKSPVIEMQGNEVGQGVSRTLATFNLKASYLLSAKANIRAEINLSAFNETIGGVSRNIFWPRIGIRTGIFNEDWDF